MCKMKCRRGGNYCREGMSVELFCSRSDGYGAVIDKACFALSLVKKEQKFSLFTTTGALIVDDGNWTLGDYLQKLHKSDARFEIGELSGDDLPSTSVCMQV